MNIACICPLQNKSGDITESMQKSHGASVRLQIYPALQAATQQGHNFKAYSIRNKNDIKKYLEIQKIDFLLIGKVSGKDDSAVRLFSEAILGFAEAVQKNNGLVGVLYSDNLLTSKVNSTKEFYQKIINLCDIIMCPTKTLKKHCYHNLKSKKLFHIIEDPCFVKRQKFRPLSPQEETIRIAWFGHESNISFLIKELPTITSNLDQMHNYEIAILTSEQGIKLAYQAAQSIIKNSKNIKIKFKFSQWAKNRQPTQLEKFLGKSHLSIIPSDPRNSRKNGASHNRLVDSIQSGCIGIASPIDSYRELKRCALITSDMSNGINYAINHYETISNHIESLREQELSRFKQSTNARKWNAFFNTVEAKINSRISRNLP